MGSLSQPLGASVRRAVRESLAASVGGGEPPGMLTCDQDGCLLSLNAHAGAWLEQLPRQELVPTGFGLSVPPWLLVTAARSAKALRRGRDGSCTTPGQPIHRRWHVGRAPANRS